MKLLWDFAYVPKEMRARVVVFLEGSFQGRLVVQIVGRLRHWTTQEIIDVLIDIHIHTFIHTCMHACIHSYIHACMHTYIHTHTYIDT